MLRKVNEWAKFNKMEFGINKCATMVIRPENSLFQNKRDPTFYLAGKTIPVTDCYTYLGIPFHKSLSRNYFIKALKNKATKALFSISNFLKNPKIPIPFKRTILILLLLVEFHTLLLY